MGKTYWRICWFIPMKFPIDKKRMSFRISTAATFGRISFCFINRMDPSKQVCDDSDDFCWTGRIFWKARIEPPENSSSKPSFWGSSREFWVVMPKASFFKQWQVYHIAAPLTHCHEQAWTHLMALKKKASSL